MILKRLFFITVFLCFFVTFTQAQENLVLSGGDATGTNGSVSYSLGQIVYTTNTGTNGQELQGLQQPYEVYEMGSLGLDEYPEIDLSVNLYPNPTISDVILTIREQQNESLNYQLYDLNGRLLLTDKVNGQETIIPMAQLPAAAYIFKITLENQVIKTFKIIKNK